MIVHVKYFLLLSRKLICNWSCSTTGTWVIHDSESHASWNENISSLSIIWRSNSCLNHVIVVGFVSTCDAVGMFVVVVGNISAVRTGSDCSFLVMTV